MSMKESYEKKIQAQLDEWNAEVNRLKARAEKAEADAQLEYYKEIEDLRSRQMAARDKLDELRAAGDSAWEDLKAGVDNATRSLGEAIRSATERFR